MGKLASVRHPEAMRRSVAVVAALLALAGECVAIAVSSAGEHRWNEAAVGSVVLAYAAVGLLIVWHRPANPIGRIALAAAAIWGPGQALTDLGANALREDPANRTAALASAVGSTLGGLPWLMLVLWLPLVFPDGGGPDTRLRRTARRVVAATIACFLAVSVLSPNLTRIEFDGIDSPIGLPHAFETPMDGMAGLSLLLGLASICLAVACLVQQYRRGGPLGRQQTLIFGLAFVPPMVAFAASVTDSAGPWVFGVSTLPLPLAIGVAVLQRRLYDLPLVVNRSATYALLWAAIATLYAVVVGGVGAMLRQQGAAWLPWLAAGVVAVSFAPLRDALQRAANRLTFGQWSQPAEVLARTSRRLADAGDVGGLLGSLAAELADDLRLGHVQITGRDGRVLAMAGPPASDLDELPLTAYGETVGALRWKRRSLRASDRELLSGVATQLGAVVHADGLLASVRAAQERLVLAREEERRRLRRDLHDGLGPALAALMLQVDTLHNTVHEQATRSALLELRGRIQDTVIDVRSIVEGLRPAALDDLGLVESIRQLTTRFSRDDSPAIVLEADPVPPLPAAVEVGAYRIVQESVTNAVRHARASRVRVGLHLRDGCLEVCVSDDGTGHLVPRPDGVGLGSMRERAEEIGGRLEVVATPGQGTKVHARLPVAAGARS
jgi:signal transduction histidine kinase